MGYTSLGGTDDTHPNPALKRKAAAAVKRHLKKLSRVDRDMRRGRAAPRARAA